MDIHIVLLSEGDTGGTRVCGIPEWEEEAACRRYHKHGTYTHFVVQFSNNMSLSKHPCPNLKVAIDSKVAISKGV